MRPYYNFRIMRYDPARHHRRSIRLRHYDYSQPGAYFVTICTKDHECIPGDVPDGHMCLSEFGRVVSQEWQRSAVIRREISLDSFVVMPNHIHGIVVIEKASHRPVAVGAHGGAPLRSPRSLGSLLAGLKSASTKRINELRGTPGLPLWQRNYHERVIRNEDELRDIRDYVENHPRVWDSDMDTDTNIVQGPGMTCPATSCTGHPCF